MFTELAHFPQFPQPDNDWHERAAIMEFDGGISRPLAEAPGGVGNLPSRH